MSKRKRYGTGDEELDLLLHDQKRLTAQWYTKISGNGIFTPTERKTIEDKNDFLNAMINKRMPT